MKIDPRAVLATALAGSLTVIYCRPTPGPVEIEPPATLLAVAWPDRLAVYVAKDRLARDAAAGRRPLAEAASLYRALDTDRLADAFPPANSSECPLRIPADSEAGRYCRQVVLVAFAALWPEGRPQVADAVARLEAEYFAAVEADGTFRLPDPASLEPVEELLRQARAWIAEQDRRRGDGPRRPAD